MADVTINILAGQTHTLTADLTAFDNLTISGVDHTSVFDFDGFKIANASLTGNVSITNCKLYDGGSPAPLTNTTGKTITGATNATPIVIQTSAPHAYPDGAVALIESVGGNLAANGVRYVKATGQDSTHYALYSDSTLTTPVAGTGAYTSGGTCKRVENESFSESDSLMAILLGAGAGRNITIQNCLIDLCAPFKLSFSSTATATISGNEQLANMKRFQPPITDSTFGMVNAGVIRYGWWLVGTGTGAKTFTNNVIREGPIVFESGATIWTIMGNKLAGDRCAIYSSADNDIGENYWHCVNEYPEFPTNVYGSQVSALILTNHSGTVYDNVGRGGEWCINQLWGEVYGNWFSDLQSHNWVLGMGANAKVHHNIFTPNFGQANVGLNEGVKIYTVAAGRELYNNTFHGGPEMITPVVGISEGKTVLERDNIYYKNYTNVLGRRAIIGAIVEESLPFSDPEVFEAGSGYSLFYNPDAHADTTDRGGLELVGGGAPPGDVSDQDPQFAGPALTDFPYDDEDILDGTVTVSQMLADVRSRYRPSRTGPAATMSSTSSYVGAVEPPEATASPRTRPRQMRRARAA